MSYSIGARGATKQDAKDDFATKFDHVVDGQPTHARDREAVVAAVGAFLDLLDDSVRVGRDAYVSVSGSLDGTWDRRGTSAGLESVSGASVQIRAQWMSR